MRSAGALIRTESCLELTSDGPEEMKWKTESRNCQGEQGVQETWGYKRGFEGAHVRSWMWRPGEAMGCLPLLIST